MRRSAPRPRSSSRRFSRSTARRSTRFLASEPRLALYRLYLDDIQRRARAHAHRRGRAPARQRRRHRQRAVEHLRHPLRRRLPVPDGDAERRQDACRLDSSGYSLYRAVPNRERPAEGHGGVLRRARQVPRHVRHRRSTAQVQIDIFYASSREVRAARSSGARRPERPDLRLHAPDRRRQPAPADVPSVPEAAPADDAAAGSALLRSVRAARRLGRSRLLDRRGAEARPRVAGAARGGVHRRRAAGLHGALDRPGIPSEGKRAGAYSNGGAYDVHPYMLLNYNGKYADMSTRGPRARPHDAQLSSRTRRSPIRPRPIRSSSPRWRPPSTRRCSSSTCSRRSPTIRRKLSLLGNYLEGIKGDGLPPDAVRRVRAADARDRREGRAAHGRGARRRSTPTSRRKYYGHDQGVCIVDDYVAHEWAFIPHFYRNFYVFQYATSFTAAEALAEKVLAGDAAATKRFLTFLGAGGPEVPDRSAEGRRRRHDHRRTAGADDREDESGDGRSRGAFPGMPGAGRSRTGR